MKSIRFPFVLFVFFLVTVLPQMLYVERGDSIGTVLKGVLLATFFCISFLKLLKINISIDIKELLVGIIFLGLQYFINIIPSRYSYLSIEIVMSFAISTCYYIFLEGLFGKLKITRDEISVFARLYQGFIVYACTVNVFLNWSNLLQMIRSLEPYTYNFQSFFSNRNTFALFLLVGAILSLYRIHIKGKGYIDIFILIFVTVNLILTQSRTSILGLITFVIVIVLLGEPKKGLNRFLKLVGFISVSIIVVYITGLGDFFVLSIIRADAGSASRTEIWRYTFDLIKNNNIISGLGFGIDDHLNSHNTYLNIFAIGGLVFTLFYFMIFTRTFNHTLRVIKEDYSLGIYFIAALLCFLTISITESIIPYFPSAQSLIFTILVFMIPKYYKNALTV